MRAGFLISLIEYSADTETLSKMSCVASELFCAMAGCKPHRPPLIRCLPDEGLDVWILIANNFLSDLDSLRALAILIDHSPRKTLATELQPTSRRAILERVWLSLRSPDRRIRITAG